MDLFKEPERGRDLRGRILYFKNYDKIENMISNFYVSETYFS
jgi:hypothetical protein